MSKFCILWHCFVRLSHLSPWIFLYFPIPQYYLMHTRFFLLCIMNFSRPTRLTWRIFFCFTFCALLCAQIVWFLLWRWCCWYGEQRETYKLEVHAEDKGFPPLARSVEVQIDVVDRANNPPVWDHTAYGPVSVKENVNVGAKVVSVKARSVHSWDGYTLDISSASNLLKLFAHHARNFVSFHYFLVILICFHFFSLYVCMFFFLLFDVIWLGKEGVGRS